MISILSKLKLAAIIAVALIMCGCATTQQLSNTDRARLSAARISGNVEKGQVFLLAPGGANIGLMFGAVGGLAASGSIEDSRKAFAAFLEKNSLSIEKIVHEEIERAVRESGKLTIAATGESQAPTINISVPQYGFGVVQSTTWSQLHDDPRQIEDQWRKASRYLARKLINTL